MRKTLIAAASGLALAVGSMTIPTPASADPVLVPALIAAGIGGLGLGAVAAANAPRPTDTVIVPERQGYYAAPAALTAASTTVVEQTPCYWTRARIGGALRRVQVCD